MKLSLIVTSRGNTNALTRLFQSIQEQKNVSLDSIEVIFADQDDNIRLINQFPCINFRYLKIPLSSLSTARNEVIKYAHGEIIGFPDDDCWYPQLFFSELIRFFDIHPAKSMFLCNIKDPKINRYYGDRPIKKLLLNDMNIYFLPSSVSLFLNRQIIKYEDIWFNEDFGVGSKWGAGEDVEIAFRIYKKYDNCFYDGTKDVYHPVILGGDTKEKAYNYGKGSGALAAYLYLKGNYSHLMIYLKYVSRSLLGMWYYIFWFKLENSKVYFFRFCGLLIGLFNGYIYFRNSLRKQSTNFNGNLF